MKTPETAKRLPFYALGCLITTVPFILIGAGVGYAGQGRSERDVRWGNAALDETENHLAANQPAEAYMMDTLPTSAQLALKPYLSGGKDEAATVEQAEADVEHTGQYPAADLPLAGTIWRVNQEIDAEQGSIQALQQGLVSDHTGADHVWQRVGADARNGFVV